MWAGLTPPSAGCADPCTIRGPSTSGADMPRFVIAIDQGTTGSTVLVLDEQLAVRGRGYKEFRQIYPQPGWVEHDPEDIWGSVTAALAQAMAGIDAKTIAAIGITNQRETAVLWDRKTGKAAHNAIVWQ